jgi:hypothetical protein
VVDELKKLWREPESLLPFLYVDGVVTVRAPDDFDTSHRGVVTP